jgi:tripartite-type tricarboxylate transporter receptor subunit TctC
MAQVMPQQVRIIVPFPAGGTQDAVARDLALYLAPRIQRPVLVENRSGAGGNVGTDAAAKATPDGSVLVLASSGSLANNKLLYKNLPYNPETDLAPIAFIGETPMFVLVKKSSPYQRLGDLLRDGGNPGQGALNFGSPGNGTIGHLTLELLRQHSKREITHVPYKGGANVVADTLGQIIDGGVDLYSSASVAHSQNGSLRILAVTSSERMPGAPNVPTTAEEGFPELRSTTWFALVGPKGLPSAYVQRMNTEVNTYLRSEGGAVKLLGLGIRVHPSSPEFVTQRMAEELSKWAPIVRARKISLD